MRRTYAQKARFSPYDLQSQIGSGKQQWDLPVLWLFTSRKVISSINWDYEQSLFPLHMDRWIVERKEHANERKSPVAAQGADLARVVLPSGRRFSCSLACYFLSTSKEALVVVYHQLLLCIFPSYYFVTMDESYRAKNAASAMIRLSR